MPHRHDRVALRLLHPHQLKSSFALASQPLIHNSALVGLQAGLVMALALPLSLNSPWPHLTGFAGLGALVAVFARFAPQGQRIKRLMQCSLLQVAGVALMSLAVWLGAPREAQLLLLALMAAGLYYASVSLKLGPPGAMLFVFAAGAAMGEGLTTELLFARPAATAAVALLSVVICALFEGLRHKPAPDRPFPPDIAPSRELRVRAAGRIFIGTGAAALIAHALGWHHPEWAALGAMAVLQGNPLRLSLQRAVQRMAGTLLGALLAWAVITAEPSPYALIAVLVAIQISVEMVIGSNYAIGQILVTPMALLMSALALGKVSGSAMAGERIVDTAIGAGLGLVLAVVLSTKQERLDFLSYHAEAVNPGAKD